MITIEDLEDFWADQEDISTEEQPEPEEVVCECGAEKAGTTHANYCPKNCAGCGGANPK